MMNVNPDSTLLVQPTALFWFVKLLIFKNSERERGLYRGAALVFEVSVLLMAAVILGYDAESALSCSSRIIVFFVFPKIELSR